MLPQAIPLEIPDLGSVGVEMSLLLRKLSDRARPDLLRLSFDMTGDLADAKSSFADAVRSSPAP